MTTSVLGALVIEKRCHVGRRAAGRKEERAKRGRRRAQKCLIALLNFIQHQTTNRIVKRTAKIDAD